MNVHNPNLCTKLAAKGARLGDGVRVFLTPEMISDAVGTAKKDITIVNRLGRSAMQLGAHQIYFGTGSDLINTWDVETQKRRPSVLADVGRAARLCDTWANSGSQDYTTRACKLAREMLLAHKPVPLEESLKRRLLEISCL